VNKLLGRRRKTLWDRGYDSPILLDLDKARKEIEYTYLNPCEAGLESSVLNYPGLSSWEYRGLERKVIHTRRIARTNFEKLEEYNLTTSKAELKRLLKLPTTKCRLELSPNAWISCYSKEIEALGVNRQITENIREAETKLARSREKSGAKVLGRAALENQPMDMEYASKKYSKKMICLGSCKQGREEFISWVKQISKEAKDLLAQVCQGVCSLLELPRGLFAPGRFCAGVLMPQDCPI
jgi:hypothetical protein